MKFKIILVQAHFLTSSLDLNRRVEVKLHLATAGRTRTNIRLPAKVFVSGEPKRRD
jgi:hypothetical protein